MAAPQEKKAPGTGSSPRLCRSTAQCMASSARMLAAAPASYRSDLGGAWAWICQLTRNTAIDWVRRAERRPESSDDLLLGQLIGDDSGLWQRHHDLSRCLRKIREEPRTAIVSAYLYGLTHAELSERLQTPLGTLKSWIRRGLKELHLCLDT